MNKFVKSVGKEAMKPSTVVLVGAVVGGIAIAPRVMRGVDWVRFQLGLI